MLTELITIPTLKSYGTEVFTETMITMISDSYDALESTLTRMKHIELSYFPGETFSGLCASVVDDS